MAKYIIDLPDNTQWVEWVKTNGRTASMDFLNVEDLEVYEEPDLEGALGEAFDDGYDVGLKASWDAARKIVHGELWLNAKKGSEWTCAQDVIDSITAKEAMGMIKEEEASHEVRAGDEIVMQGESAVVYFVDDQYAYFVHSDGRRRFYYKKDMVRTGNCFSEIAVLSQKLHDEICAALEKVKGKQDD